jgi:hypothetical protein
MRELVHTDKTYGYVGTRSVTAHPATFRKPVHEVDVPPAEGELGPRGAGDDRVCGLVLARRRTVAGVRPNREASREHQGSWA